MKSPEHETNVAHLWRIAQAPAASYRGGTVQTNENRFVRDLRHLLHVPSNRAATMSQTGIGAQGEIRTHTMLPSGDFESPASTIPPLGLGQHL